MSVVAAVQMASGPNVKANLEEAEKIEVSLTPEQEIESLRARVAQLTLTGHELISTQTRMQSLLHNATDAIIQADRL